MQRYLVSYDCSVSVDIARYDAEGQLITAADQVLHLPSLVMPIARSSLLYTQQAPSVPHVSCQIQQESSNTFPRMIGPGTLPAVKLWNKAVLFQI